MVAPRVFLVPLAVLFGAGLTAAPLPEPPPIPAETAAGWQRYVSAAEQRITLQMQSARQFLGLDFESSASADRQTVLSGALVVGPMPGVAGGTGSSDVPGGWIHHWRGAVLIPRVGLDQLFQRLQAEVPGSGQDDVLASAILQRDGPRLRVFLKVQRRQNLIGLAAITAVYATEHLVTFARRDATRGSSTSTATRIAELSGAGTPDERELAPGQDHGFLWRWNSYWRYQQVAAGVIAECESITLSRQAPYGTRWAAEPLAAEAASESMTRALGSLRGAFSRGRNGSAPPARLMPAETRPAWSPVQ